jgi:LacI family transcriptional regulator
VISNNKKRVTIKDVAQAAGVSTQTVSRVMNKFSYVSEDTRRRVEEVVERLGYNPSALARSLIQRRSYTLGVVTSGLKHIGPSRTLNGVADKADELGYMLLMKELDNFDNSRVGEVIDSLLARQVDGIVWAAPEIGDNHSWLDERLDRIPVPVIFLSMRPREGVFSVATDNYQGGVMAIRHLLECGRKKIGHISGPLAWWEALERKRAWRETLAEAGLDAREEHCAEGNWSPASGEQAFIRLLESYPGMDAIFVANDQMALSVLREAARRGVSVPSQLAVVGFDNIPEAAFFHPSLTRVFQVLQLLGEQAAQLVVEMIQARQQEKPTVAQSKFLQPTLIIRESSQ